MAFAPTTALPEPPKGVMRLIPPSELEADAARKEAEAESARKPMLVLDDLAEHINRMWQNAKAFRERGTGATGVSLGERFLQCKRQREGQYEPDIQRLIQAAGGNDEFFNITDTKCAGAEAWMRDVITPSGDKAWGLEPTPVPDLSDTDTAEVQSQLEMLILHNGIRDPQQIIALADELADMRLDEIQRVAKEKAMRMEERMNDQLVEGGYYSAMANLRRYLTTFPVGILKGPVVRIERALKWSGSAMTVVDREIPTWTAPDPQDVFFAPNACNIQDSYVVERIRWSKSALSQMRKQPGYSSDAIDAVLTDSNAKLDPTTTDFERSELESRDSTINQGLSEDSLEGVEFWGAVEGRMLMEWGLDGVKDPFRYYEIQAIKFGPHIIKAILNPHPLGRKPYYATSFVKLPGNMYGISIPEKMRDCQRAYNAALRNLIDNAALAAGPIIGVNVDALAPGQDMKAIRPRMIISYNEQGSVIAGRQPVQAFEIPMIAADLLQIAEYFEAKADDRTLVPRYQIGASDVGQVGETASGMSMLMNAAAKGIKQVISNIDEDILNPSLSDLYVWNMSHLDDDSIKGDARVVPKGYLARIVRETLQSKRQEFLDRTNNPVDLQIIGMDGRRKVLDAISSDLEIDDLIPGNMQMPMAPMEGGGYGEDAGPNVTGGGPELNQFGATRNPDDGRMVVSE